MVSSPPGEDPSTGRKPHPVPPSCALGPSAGLWALPSLSAGAGQTVSPLSVKVGGQHLHCCPAGRGPHPRGPRPVHHEVWGQSTPTLPQALGPEGLEFRTFTRSQMT